MSHVHSLAFVTYTERMNVIDFYTLLLLRLLLQFTDQADVLESYRPFGRCLR